MNNISNVITLIYLVMSAFFIIGYVESHAFREIQRQPDELAKTSKDVVVANCIKSEVKQDENTGFIFTYTTFKVTESLKGEYGDEIVLRIIGGTMGDITVKASGTPAFEPNEDVILFLGPKNTMGYPVLQSVQNGVYRIGTDQSGKKIVTTPVGDLEIINSQTNQRIENTNRIYLDDFIHTISQSM